MITFVHYCQLVHILSQLNAIHTCLLLRTINTDVFEVRSVLVVLNAVFSKFINNGQREVSTVVRDKSINNGQRSVHSCQGQEYK